VQPLFYPLPPGTRFSGQAHIGVLRVATSGNILAYPSTLDA
jgi:hypothetical protein